MKRILFSIAIILMAFQITKAQSIYKSGVFPTIDHTGTISKKIDYSIYYFGAFPIVNFTNTNEPKDANFLLFYSEQALTLNVKKRLSFTGSFVYQREYVNNDNYSNENRFVSTPFFEPVIDWKFKFAEISLSISKGLNYLAINVDDLSCNLPSIAKTALLVG